MDMLTLEDKERSFGNFFFYTLSTFFMAPTNTKSIK